MKRAVSLLDQREWGADEFGNQDQQTQGTHSKYLVCISCKVRARFHPGSAKDEPPSQHVTQRTAC
jgi:hypothetical protein